MRASRRWCCRGAVVELRGETIQFIEQEFCDRDGFHLVACAVFVIRLGGGADYAVTASQRVKAKHLAILVGMGESEVVGARGARRSVSRNKRVEVGDERAGQRIVGGLNFSE